MKDIIYLCKYQNDDYRQVIVFATKKLKTAENWVNKFNKKLEYWKEYYSQFSDENHKGIIDDKYYDIINPHHFWKVMEINEAFITEIDLRK